MSRVTCPSCGYSNNAPSALTCNMCMAVLQRADKKEGSGKEERPTKPAPQPQPPPLGVPAPPCARR